MFTNFENMAQKPSISFHFNNTSFKLVHRNQLKMFISSLFAKENTVLQSLQYIFCTDEYLLGINTQYLGHDDYTDIITFDLSAATTSATEGEIYISIDRVRENARTHQTPFLHELYRVIFHGALHLCGYGDKKAKEKALMTQKENYYIEEFLRNVPRGTKQ
jgi:probable rRNA maturation factor